MKEEDLDLAKIVDQVDLNELDEDLEQCQQDEFIQEALKKGLDLRQYAQEIQQELREVEKASMDDYLAQAPAMVNLYHEMNKCDTILSHMQEMLLGFQADLGGISDEIRTLQEQSISMNIQLKNRKETESLIHKFLDEILLLPSWIKILEISPETADNESYIQALRELDKKLKYVNSTPDSNSLIVPGETMAVKDLQVELNQLKQCCIARIREYFWNKMQELKKPMTNVQMFQQNVLLKMKELMQFLTNHDPTVAKEFQDIYIETMDKMMSNLFRNYHANLIKLCIPIATKNDVIALEENASSRLAFSISKKKPQALGPISERVDILEQIAGPPIIIHVAQAEKKKFYYEEIFRSLQQHLMNSATSEYIFMIDFFQSRPRDLFMQIFAKTLSLCLEHLEDYLFTCYDIEALLLMIRITHAQRLIMEKRRIPCLDSYFDRVTMLLWPRFNVVFDSNLKSIQQAKVKKLHAKEYHPHYITRRYADFVASILYLHGRTTNSSGGDYIDSFRDGADEMVLNNLHTLRNTMVQFLNRLSMQHDNKKHQVVLLINNYDQILQVFEQHQITSDETIKFDEYLAEQREAYVEEELMENYPKLIEFLRKAEASYNQSLEQGSSYELNAREIKIIVEDFKGHWRSGIQEMNSHIMTYFTNFKNGMVILKQVLTQLLLYYTRFIEILRKQWPGKTKDDNLPEFGNDLVTTPEILAEIKKYSRSF